MRYRLPIFLLLFSCFQMQAQEDSVMVFKVRKPPPNIVEVRLQLLNTLRVSSGGTLPQFYNGLSGLEKFFEANVPYRVDEGEERARVTFRLSNNGQAFTVKTDSVSATTHELVLAVKDAMANMADWSSDCYGGVDNLGFAMDVIFKPWQEKSSQTELRQVMKPFPGARQKPHRHFTFRAEKGFFKHFENGTQIIIPPNAFVDASGKVVAGEVEVTFRDFNTVQELMANGISTGLQVMAADSSKYVIPFQSGGVVEFRAYKNKQELQLDKNKKVLLETVSNFTEIDLEVQHWNPETNNWELDGRETTGIRYALDTFSAKRVKLEKIKYRKRDSLLIVNLVFVKDKVRMPDVRMLQRYYWKIHEEEAAIVKEMLRKKRTPGQPANLLSFRWLMPKRSEDRFSDVQWVYDEGQHKMSLILYDGFKNEERVIGVKPVFKNNLTDYHYSSRVLNRYYSRYFDRYQKRKEKELPEKFDFFAQRKNFTSAAEKFATSRCTVIPPMYSDSLVRSFFVDSTGLYMCAMRPPWRSTPAVTGNTVQAQNLPARFADDKYREVKAGGVYIGMPSYRSVLIFDNTSGEIPLYLQRMNFAFGQLLIVPSNNGKGTYISRNVFCAPNGFSSFDIFIRPSENESVFFPVAGFD